MCKHLFDFPTAHGNRAMENLTHYPSLVFAIAFTALWFTSAAGSWLR
jgi:hypothetical protein